MSRDWSTFAVSIPDYLAWQFWRGWCVCHSFIHESYISIYLFHSRLPDSDGLRIVDKFRVIRESHPRGCATGDRCRYARPACARTHFEMSFRQQRAIALVAIQKKCQCDKFSKSERLTTKHFLSSTPWAVPAIRFSAFEPRKMTNTSRFLLVFCLKVGGDCSCRV